jgi:hypothetical protein
VKQVNNGSSLRNFMNSFLLLCVACESVDSALRSKLHDPWAEQPVRGPYDFM